MKLPDDAPWIVRKLVFAVVCLPFQLPIILALPGTGPRGYVVSSVGMLSIAVVVAFALDRLAARSPFAAWLSK